MAFIIAIDGPAASGKGTIGRALAADLGFHHLDTGLLYRATGVKGGDPVAAARGLVAADLARDDLRSAEARASTSTATSRSSWLRRSFRPRLVVRFPVPISV